MTSTRTGSAKGTKVEVGKSRFFDPAGEDWYTPGVFRLHPKEVRVVAGKKGTGRARVEITEGEWERGYVTLGVAIESIPLRTKSHTFRTGFDSIIDDEFQGSSGPHVVRQLDNLIEALTIARREAAKAGLFTPRPTPRSIRDVEAAVQA